MKQPQRVREDEINHRKRVRIARVIIRSSRREKALNNFRFADFRFPNFSD